VLTWHPASSRVPCTPPLLALLQLL
jgi:hypothetical protein